MRARGDVGSGISGDVPGSHPATPEVAPGVAGLKRTLYLFLLPLLAAATLITGLLGAPGSFDRWVLPLVTLVLLPLVLVVRRRPQALRHVDTGIFALFALVYAGKLWEGPATPGGLDQVFIWTPLLYVLAFLLFEPRPALRASLAALAGSVVITALRSGHGAASARTLAEFFLATTLLVLMAYSLSRVRREVARLESQLSGMRALAHEDSLTGLPNRRALEAAVDSAVQLAERHRQRVSAILFDLDGFKGVNDESGHAAGDEVLRSVAERGESVLRRPDVFGRWGGEEFLVLTPGIDLPGAMTVAERLRQALGAEPFAGAGQVTASFGVASFHPGDTPDTLIGRADDALYLAKEGGKNRVEALERELVRHVELPALARPFAPIDRDTQALRRGTLAWLKAFDVAPPETLYRWLVAVQPGWLAGHILRATDADALALASDWTFWMFLHDDHCDGSEAGRDPGYLSELHQRLLAVLAGAPPEPEHGALAPLLADLRERLRDIAGEDATQRFAEATERYLAATRWEAANRASGTTPDLEDYQRMRLRTSGLEVHTVLLQALDGVPRSDHPLAAELYQAADLAVCWANDIVSLNKEVQERDVHNLVLALRASRHLGLEAALARAARMHDAQVARFQQAYAAARRMEGHEGQALRVIAEALATRMAANLAWSERCIRYRAAVTVRVPPKAASPSG